MRHWMCALAIALVADGCSCEERRGFLSVEVRSDFVPGLEVTSAAPRA